ncbi:MAG: DegT/DnrJ/EryC1/StrS family aminotransferase, partial [Planctomycetota bacterium]
MNDGDRLPALLGGTPAFPDGPPRVGFSEDVGDALRRLAADGGWARYEGPESDGLRAELAEAASVRHTRLVAGGTAAVEIALRGVGVGPGDEVVLAAYDFKANLTDVLALGATPVLV